MTIEKRTKKRSEQLSDAYAARMARASGPSGRLDAIAASGRNAERSASRASLASFQTPHQHAFTRCPHCREYVPRRDSCRGCGAEMRE
jgi:hypothetical protein